MENFDSEPRRIRLTPDNVEFSNVLRLEGQIELAIQILTYMDLYSQQLRAGDERMFFGAREEYFVLITELIFHFLDRGIDICGTTDLDTLVKEVEHKYPGHQPEDTNHPDFWAWIRFYQKLQGILQDQTKSLEEALASGWKWVMEKDGYVSKTDATIAACVDMWHALPTDKQTELLKKLFPPLIETFRGNAADTRVPNFTDPSFIAAETKGFLLGLSRMGIWEKVDTSSISHPILKEPSTTELPDCAICYEKLSAADIGTEAKHRPVQTTCSHIFGNECIQEWFTRIKACPTCREIFETIPWKDVPPEAVLQCFDRYTRWLEPPLYFTAPPAPHSWVDKLSTIVEESADSLRQNLVARDNTLRDIQSENATLSNVDIYLARDRLRAVLDGDKKKYREVVWKGAQATARSCWILFLRHTGTGPA
ncbi:hypothetical protein EJ04DRAFT_550855 [Polyplosphaeria fusca]|uniref:RING-type domain-containing protein n=1 Tax=Polyplosphaeria fusca TaxID=682080 RepID=A0A9P4R5F5_9PLEO|nr:hypothetical protein EJ04DRAFT_550855 [Polyplosphaeria fusca]